MSQLTAHGAQQALQYNRNRKYHKDLIRIIQHEVGATQDGVFGPGTVAKIHAWQQRPMKPGKPKPGKPKPKVKPRLPVADGKAGPNTLGQMASASIRRGDVVRGRRLLHELRQVLERGNGRWRDAKQQHPNQSRSRSTALLEDQRPFAVVLGCADSRVPPELVFDQGVGDVFTVRSAGQALDRAVRGSIQYAVQELQVPLVVVLGHEGCGAVQGAQPVRSPRPTDLEWLLGQIQTGPHKPTSVAAVEWNAGKVRDQLTKELSVEVAPEVLAAVYRLGTRAVGAWAPA